MSNLSLPEALAGLRDTWLEKAKALKSGPSQGATRDYEDSLAADEIKVCADALSALIPQAGWQPIVERMLWAVMDHDGGKGFVLPADSDGRFVPAEYLRELAALLPAPPGERTTSDGQ